MAGRPGTLRAGSSAVRVAVLAKSLVYVGGNLGKTEDMVHLKELLRELGSGGGQANRLFFLSINSHLYEPAIKNLGASGLSRDDNGWRRVVI